MQYDFIDKYNELRYTIEKMTRADPTIMGRDAWLVHAMQASDMILGDTDTMIAIHGSTYTTQTMDHEWFEFMIPKADIELFQIKKLLEDTARNSPTGGRDDSRGFGFIDPAAAIEAAGRIEPEGLQSASHGAKYFGSGPDADASGDDTADWAAPLAGGAGGVLLVAAVVLWRGRRTAREDF